MRTIVAILICLLLPIVTIGQGSLAELLASYNNEQIPYIQTEELLLEKEKTIVLDARETEEYTTSHLTNAIHVGYTHFSKKQIRNLAIGKDDKIIVYCSLGIRSEDIAEKLKKMGFTNVYNLYGGIFEWKNKNNIVVDRHEKPTDSIHAYSEEWGKWLLNGIKTYK